MGTRYLHEYSVRATTLAKKYTQVLVLKISIKYKKSIKIYF